MNNPAVFIGLMVLAWCLGIIGQCVVTEIRDRLHPPSDEERIKRHYRNMQ